MSTTSPKVLIVGAGPSGLICALSLLRNGVTVRIIEKCVQPRLGQRGAGIMPRSLEVFDSLGIADKILELAIVAPPMRRYELPKGSKHTHDFEMAPSTDPTPSYPYLNVVLLGQNNLEGVINAALAEYSCQVERGTELISLQQSEDGVEVNLLKRQSDNDKTGIAETVRYDWVVGADGARSVVRKQSTFTFDGETRRIERLVVGDIYVEGLSQKYWHLLGDASNTLISLRPTEVPGMFNFALGGNIDHVQLSSDEGALRRFLVETIGSEAQLKFNDLRWLSLFTPNIRMVDNYQHGRVLLVGDAAHVHSPTGGQGMNSGVQDSFNLGWKLALVLRKLAPSSLLESYSEERIPVIKEMLDRTTRLLNETFADKGDAPWARGTGLLQLGINYRWSSLVLDERKPSAEGRKTKGPEEEILDAYGGHANGPLRAGDRAPDAPGMIDLSATPQSTVRLFKIFAPFYHTVLVFTPAEEQYSALAKSLAQYPQGTVRSVVIVRPGDGITTQCRGADLVLEDREGHAHAGYGVEGDWGMMVIRPDGVVGAIVSGVDGLQKYFGGIFGQM